VDEPPRKEQINRTTGALKKIKSQFPRPPGRGTPALVFDHHIREAFEKMQVLAPAWDAFVALLVVRRDAEGHDEYWLTEGAESAFNEDSIFGGRINRSLYEVDPNPLSKNAHSAVIIPVPGCHLLVYCCRIRSSCCRSNPQTSSVGPRQPSGHFMCQKGSWQISVAPTIASVVTIVAFRAEL
jgi:hypothetical protein